MIAHDELIIVIILIIQINVYNDCGFFHEGQERSRQLNRVTIPTFVNLWNFFKLENICDVQLLTNVALLNGHLGIMDISYMPLILVTLVKGSAVFLMICYLPSSSQFVAYHLCLNSLLTMFVTIRYLQSFRPVKGLLYLLLPLRNNGLFGCDTLQCH